MSSASIAELTATIRALTPVDRVELFYAIGIGPSRHERMRARDHALREMGARMLDVASGRDMARRIHEALEKYAATGWRFERNRRSDPADPLRRLAYAVLRCNSGEVPSFSTIRAVLAGIENLSAVAKNCR